ncbi:MAG: adenylate kinase [Candidatus Aminicenantes bacterium]|nr:adenylate kinase [Candidatus Aminicenantes bacterium]
MKLSPKEGKEGSEVEDNKMKRIILFGAPGSGKGTQADALEQQYGWEKISTGDLVRAEVAAQTPIGREIKPLIEMGQLAPDETVLKILKNRLAQGDLVNGYILDGFPRNLAQAEELTRLAVDSETAIFLKIVNDDVVVGRLTSRLTCSQCGAIYNSVGNPPLKTGQCDLCGGPVRQRADDNEETVRRRINVYREQTQPVIDYYKRLGKLHEVDASGTVEEVSAAIAGAIN